MTDPQLSKLLLVWSAARHYIEILDGVRPGNRDSAAFERHNRRQP